MLRRISDYYNWTKLTHWNEALIDGSVKWGQISDEKHIGDIVLYSAIGLLINNCYPISLICYTCMNEKMLLFSPLWKGIIQFVNGKRSIFVNERNLFFQDFSENEQNAILNANVHSVWITSDNSDDLSKISIMLTDLKGYI